MSVRGFGRTILFGASAAVAYPGFALLASPVIGGHAALALFVGSTAILYAGLLGRSWRERLEGACVAAAFAIPAALVSGAITGVAIGAALGIAMARSRLLGSRAIPRTIAIESGLALLGFAFVNVLAGGDWASISLAIWGWFLVQSLWFLSGAAARPEANGGVDPFDLASERANRILEHE